MKILALKKIEKYICEINLYLVLVRSDCESRGHGLAGPVGEIKHNSGHPAHLWSVCVEILRGGTLEGQAKGLQSVGRMRLTNLVPLRKLSVLAGYCSPVHLMD